MVNTVESEIVAKNRTQIEEIILQHDATFSTNGISWNGALLDEMINDYSRFNDSATVFDVIREVIEGGDASQLDKFYLRYLFNAVKFRINIDKVAQSPSNLLNYPDPTCEWEERYKHAVALFMREYGDPEAISPSVYSWKDFESFNKYSIVAMFNIAETSWDEFDGTDVSVSNHHGVTVEAVYADGTNRILRWEGAITEIIQKVTTY